MGKSGQPKQETRLARPHHFQIPHDKSYIGILERGKTKIIKRSGGIKQTVKVPQSKWLVLGCDELRIIHRISGNPFTRSSRIIASRKR